MISFPSLTAARQSLAEAERRAAAAQSHLEALEAEASALASPKTPPPATLEAVTKKLEREAALARERRSARIERDLAVAARNKHEQSLKQAELADACAALDKRSAEFATRMGARFAPAAQKIVALMATSRRLQKKLRAAAKRQGADVPHFKEFLTTEEFCADLRLPNVVPNGVEGYLWYSSDPSHIDAIKAADAVPLDGIDVEAFAAGADKSERAALAAKTAMQSILAAYDEAAREIVSLFPNEQEIAAEIERLKLRTIGLRPGQITLRSPAQQLTNGRIRLMAAVVCLPAATGRGEPIWSPRPISYQRSNA